MSSITSRKKTTSKKNDRPKRVSAYNIFVSRRRKEITDEAQKKKEAEKIANAIQAALNANATGVKADGKEEGKSEEKEEKTSDFLKKVENPNVSSFLDRYIRDKTIILTNHFSRCSVTKKLSLLELVLLG